MNIVLTGFMGTGKSVVGRHLANELRLPFMDVDSTIKKRAGKSIPEIFAADGEAAFRKLEHEAIVELAQQDKTVISTGGGALLDPRNREALQRHGILVCLTAKMGTLLERLKEDLSRPLLAGANPEQKIELLMKERESIYNLCPVQVATDGKTIAQVSAEIIQKLPSTWMS